MKTSWSVTVVYDDEAKRAEAVRFCDQLVQRFWAGAELDLNWWSVEQLRKASATVEAVTKASHADVVVLAMKPESELPLEVDYWMENWVARRGDHEGMLVGLLGPDTAGPAAQKHLRLRKIAHRGGMDYLTGLPDYAAHRIPDSLEGYHDRAHRMTNVMDEILHHPPTPHLTT